MYFLVAISLMTRWFGGEVTGYHLKYRETRDVPLPRIRPY